MRYLIDIVVIVVAILLVQNMWRISLFVLRWWRRLLAALGFKSRQEADLESALKKLNCSYKLMTANEGKSKNFIIDFQGGHYLANIDNGKSGTIINFLGIMTVDVDELPAVRILVNRYNRMARVHKYVYEPDDDGKSVSVNIEFFMDDFEHYDKLRMLMESCFSMQRDFLDEYKEIDKDGDAEMDFLGTTHDRYVERQHELQLYKLPVENAADNNATALTLGTVLTTIAGFSGHEVLQSLKVVIGNDVSVTDDAESIKSLNLNTLFISKDGDDYSFADTDAVLVLRYRTDALTRTERTLTIALTADGSDDNTLYYRVTVTKNKVTASQNGGMSVVNSQLVPINALVGFDKADDSQHRKEFDYMYTDIKMKIDHGDEDKLTDDEALWYKIYNNFDVRYLSYWAVRYVRSERFMEAVVMFNQVYHNLRDIVFKMTDQERYFYREMCYYMGTCYRELGDYEKAAYFLGIATLNGNHRYRYEQINCMIAARDPRVFDLIGELYKELDELAERNPDEESDYRHDMRRQLARQNTLADIAFCFYEQAEKRLHDMLESDEEEDRDFAINELAYVHKLRVDNGEIIDDSADSDSISKSGSE